MKNLIDCSGRRALDPWISTPILYRMSVRWMIIYYNYIYHSDGRNFSICFVCFVTLQVNREAGLSPGLATSKQSSRIDKARKRASEKSAKPEFKIKRRKLNIER